MNDFDNPVFSYGASTRYSIYLYLACGIKLDETHFQNQRMNIKSRSHSILTFLEVIVLIDRIVTISFRYDFYRFYCTFQYIFKQNISCKKWVKKALHTIYNDHIAVISVIILNLCKKHFKLFKSVIGPQLNRAL